MRSQSNRRAKTWLSACVVALLSLALTSGPALGHAYLRQATPADGARLTTAPTEVVLEYTEPVEVPFSTFKVYKVATVEDPLQQRALASRLVSDVLRTRGDEDARADKGLVEVPRRPSERIRIQLRDNLEPGTYVVMWHVLSIDTHTTQGFHLFSIEP